MITKSIGAAGDYTSVALFVAGEITGKTLTDDLRGQIVDNAYTETYNIDFSGGTDATGFNITLEATGAGLGTRPVITCSNIKTEMVTNPANAFFENLEFNSDATNFLNTVSNKAKFYRCEIRNFTALVPGLGEEHNFINCYIHNGVRIVADQSGAENFDLYLQFCSIYDVDFGYDVTSVNANPYIENCIWSLLSTQRVNNADGSDYPDGNRNNCYEFNGTSQYSDTYTTVEQLQGVHVGEEVSSFDEDPLVGDWTTDDFTLDDNSPCLEQAVSLHDPLEPEYDFDYYGNPRNETTPDVGAHESILGTLPGQPVIVFPTSNTIYETKERQYIAAECPKEPVEDGSIQYRLENHFITYDSEIFTAWDSRANGKWHKGSMCSCKHESNYAMSVSETLFIDVDGISETVTFAGTETDAATVVAKIVADIGATIEASVTALWDEWTDIVSIVVCIASADKINGSIQVTGGTGNAKLGFDTRFIKTYDSTDTDNFVEFEYASDYDGSSDPAAQGTWSLLGTGDPGPLGVEPADGTDADFSLNRHIAAKLPEMPINMSNYFNLRAYTGEFV